MNVYDEKALSALVAYLANGSKTLNVWYRKDVIYIIYIHLSRYLRYLLNAPTRFTLRTQKSY